MQCELCSHEVDENEVEVLEIYNDYYGEADRFWACPDCVEETEFFTRKISKYSRSRIIKSKKDQDTP